MEVLGDFFIPESDISLAIVDDRTKLGITGQIGHETVHAIDALDQVLDLVLIVLVVESLDRVLDALAQNGGQTDTHSGMGERVLMVATVRGPGRVVGINLGKCKVRKSWKMSEKNVPWKACGATLP